MSVLVDGKLNFVSRPLGWLITDPVSIESLTLTLAQSIVAMTQDRQGSSSLTYIRKERVMRYPSVRFYCMLLTPNIGLILVFLAKVDIEIDTIVWRDLDDSCSQNDLQVRSLKIGHRMSFIGSQGRLGSVLVWYIGECISIIELTMVSAYLLVCIE